MKRKIDNSSQMMIEDFLREHSRSETDSEGRLRIIDRLRSSMRSSIKGCHLSRHQIAGEMSHLTGETVTKALIDSWTRESNSDGGPNRRRIPAELLPAFCHVTGCSDPLMVLGEIAGLFVLPGADALRAEIRKDDEKIKRYQSQRKKRILLLQEYERRASS